MGWLTDLADTAMADVAAARNSLEAPALAAAPIARANAAVGLPPLPPASESRRQKVLAILARNGGHYATLVEDPNTDPVVMAVATPDATCDLQIPRDRYNPFAILAMVVGWSPEHHVPRSAA